MQPQPPQPHHHQCRLFVCVCPTVPVTIVVVAPPAPPTCNRIRIRNRIRNRIRQCKHLTVASLHHYLCVSVTPELPKSQTKVKKPASQEKTRIFGIQKKRYYQKKWSKSQIFRSRSLPNSITHRKPIQRPHIQATYIFRSFSLAVSILELELPLNPIPCYILRYPCQSTHPAPSKPISAFLPPTNTSQIKNPYMNTRVDHQNVPDALQKKSCLTYTWVYIEYSSLTVIYTRYL